MALQPSSRAVRLHLAVCYSLIAGSYAANARRKTMMSSSIQLSMLRAWLPVVIAGIASVNPTLSQSSTNNQAAISDSFVFTTKSFQPYSQVSLGNGYLIGSTPWNGTAPASSTLAGLYDHLEEKAYSYQALVPSWN